MQWYRVTLPLRCCALSKTTRGSVWEILNENLRCWSKTWTTLVCRKVLIYLEQTPDSHCSHFFYFVLMRRCSGGSQSLRQTVFWLSDTETSVMPWRNVLKFGTNIQLDWRINGSDFSRVLFAWMQDFYDDLEGTSSNFIKTFTLTPQLTM